VRRRRGAIRLLLMRLLMLLELLLWWMGHSLRPLIEVAGRRLRCSRKGNTTQLHRWLPRRWYTPRCACRCRQLTMVRIHDAATTWAAPADLRY